MTVNLYREWIKMEKEKQEWGVELRDKRRGGKGEG